MSRRIKKLYFDIQTASKELIDFTKGKDYTEFHRNRLLQVAVEREFEIMGEAMNRILREFPEEAESIPNIRRIIGMRNILVHGYDIVDRRILWDTIQSEIDALIDFTKGKL